MFLESEQEILSHLPLPLPASLDMYHTSIVAKHFQSEIIFKLPFLPRVYSTQKLKAIRVSGGEMEAVWEPARLSRTIAI